MPLPPIILVDEAMVAFNRPAGLRLAPDLVRAQLGSGLALVQRPDEDASGLVLWAKTKAALDFLSGQFQARTVGQVWHALTAGIPVQEEFTVELAMKEDEARPGRMCVVKKHGAASVTEFTVLEKFPQPAGRAGFAWVECRPLTNRPHQARLHLAVSGTPILNDSLYGVATPLLLSELKRGYKGRTGERPLLARLALHAGGLTFRHPLTREPVTLTAPPPKDLALALKYLRKFGGSARRR